MRAKFILLCTTFCLLLSAGCATTAQTATKKSDNLRANHVVTMADDFVVEVYHNGVRVPDKQRKMVVERFGATMEDIGIQVQKGDWLVFHVVNNRLRWNGAYYFAAAGVIAKDEFGFVSELSSGNWSVCDDPGKAASFIKNKSYLSDNHAQPVKRPWAEGTPTMKRHVGQNWSGEPIWGLEKSTWIKVNVQ